MSKPAQLENSETRAVRVKVFDKLRVRVFIGGGWEAHLPGDRHSSKANGNRLQTKIVALYWRY